MILLDTNVVIEFFKDRAPTSAHVKQLPFSQLCISDVTQAELIFGAFNKAELGQITAGLRALSILPITAAISARMVRLMEEFCLSNRLTLPDALIVATALEHKLDLYTLNRKDFRYIPALRLYEPS